ncbi:MAG TPA: bifunctional diguanylate cyclase/phosphodiesterase [Micromonosporaceae bacterium]
MAWYVTAPLAVLALLLTIVAGARSGQLVSSWQLTLLYLGLFVAAEATVLEFEIRRHAFLVSVTEVPLVLALFYLSPVTIIATRVVAAAIVQSRRGNPAVKLWFNLASFTAATAAAALVVDVFRPLTNVGPRTWLVLLGGVAVSVLVTLAAVLGVITLVQGRLGQGDFGRTAIPGLVVAGVNATVGLVVLLALRVSAWAVVLLSGLGLVLFVVYRAYAQFVRQHRSLTEIYELTRAIGETRYDGRLADVLVGRVRELLHAEYATLWLPAHGRYPETLLSARVDDRGLLDLPATPDAVRRRATETGATVLVTPKVGEESLREELREHGVKDVIVAPLRSGSAVIGCLEVAGRLGDRMHFSADDVRLLETVAAHAAVAVENARLVDRLRFDAYHDALTGLPNRRRMLGALEEAVKVRAPGEVVAVLQFDVAGLRDVNESLGHVAGDKLLAEVARRLRGQAPPAALVARIGGDEFAVTLRLPGADAAVAMASELRSALQDPMPIGSLTLDVDTAVGVAVHPDHGSEPATLLQRADVATYAAKSASSAVQLFNHALESRSVRRLGLAGDLRRALDNDELEVYFQPQVRLCDRRLVGVECLARWDHPAHGSVSPEDFVAVAEHTGQLSRLTEFVMTEGLRRCRQWMDAGRPLSVAINLSPRTLLDPEFPDRVEEMLRRHGVDAHLLTLEITEDGVIGETDRPMPALRRLHALGVRLAVDDFGTGYSSLSYLRRLPVQEVKIDRTFVQGMATDQGDLAIVRAVVDLSRHFGLTVVAEGVESELTLTLLDEIGCDIGQGFLFSRPLPYDRLEAWFSAQTEAEPTPGGEVRRLRAVT